MTVTVPTAHPAELIEPRSGVGILLLAWLIATMSLWFFAFYDLPLDAPDWAKRAQVACFGRNDMGLPAPAGLMLLTLSPAMFLGAIFIALYSESIATIRRIFASSVGRVVTLLLFFLVAMEVAWVSASVYRRVQDFTVLTADPTSSALPPTYPRGNDPAPDFSLINQLGESQSLAALRGKPVLLSFVFAHCQAVCPRLIATLTSASSKLPAGSIHTLLITLDPWRDTPRSLPQLAKKWNLNSDSMILSGEPEAVNAVLDQYNVPRQRDDQNGDVAHPSLVHVIDAEGRLAYSFNNPSPTWLLEALARITR